LSTTVETPPHSEAPLDREPGSGRRLRYMGRRRINRTDRNGDPLDGVVNLFDVAIIQSVGFLLAALTGIGLTGILSSKNVTIVTNPGQPDMQVITKKGSQITKLNLKAGQQVSGVGTLIGQFYRLPNGTTVYVPSSGGTTGQTPSSSGTTTPGVAVTPTPPSVVITPTPGAPPTGAPGTATPGAVTTPTPGASGATTGQ
jgi:hypothetical protein